LPASLADVYQGSLGFSEPVVYANFVSSIDGVVALGKERSSGSLISGRSEADRFVMGLLRACADVVLTGAATVRAEGRQALWTPDYIHPQAKEAFSELRRKLGRKPKPPLAVLTASGELEPDRAALKADALILTSQQGAAKLRDRVPDTVELVTLGTGRGLDVTAALDVLRARGMNVILTEGGPALIGELLRSSQLDELFLTLSPVLAGRQDGTLRRGIIHGLEFQPRELQWTRLESARRSGSHLFLRYRLSK
jgi:riboflavin biosynthesis pyrimidine reductase